MNLNKLVAAVVTSGAATLCHAGALYNAATAPDGLTKSLLTHPVASFTDGAMSASDVAGAINRNFPKIVEQNLARKSPEDAASWIDNLSDVELNHLAQLYVNANFAQVRRGQFLKVAALRLDGAHLGRLSQFFGYSPVRVAVASVAASKLSSFNSNTATSYLAPVPGAATRVEATVDPALQAQLEGPSLGATSLGSAVARVGIGGTLTAQAGFTPVVTMTLEQIYLGFRGMQVGSLAAYGALYETAVFAGKDLIAAYGAGYAAGSGITWLMQTYTPTFYSDDFCEWVGAPVTWLQNFAVHTYNLYSNSWLLGQYESETMPLFDTTVGQQNLMGSMGGDWGMTDEYEGFVGGGDPCRDGSNCTPEELN